MNPLRHWSQQLHGWAIPDEILAQAPESPWGFDVATFDRAAEDALVRDTPSRRRALEALPEGGSVLDVGCGGGAGAFALAPRLGHATGVDEGEAMLAAFAARGDALGIAHDEVHGRWPDVAARTPAADVVVCHHVVHNVADLAPFARALTDHARRRVVVEMTATHPLAWTTPLWRRFHDLDRPAGPTAEDAVAVLRDLGLDPHLEHWSGPSPWRDLDRAAATARRRLCLGAEREAEVRGALVELGPPEDRPLATVSWTG